jgi:hypothetical protein
MERNIKIMIFWVLGAVAILIGSMIAGRIQMGLGVSDLGFFFALLVSFVLILIGGLLWISVAIATKTVREEE